MSVAVPIKELKDTTGFTKKVQDCQEVRVTRNGTDVFAALTMEQLEAYKLEAARARLYDLVDEAEQDFRLGRTSDARSSQASARARYGL